MSLLALAVHLPLVLGCVRLARVWSTTTSGRFCNTAVLLLTIWRVEQLGLGIAGGLTGAAVFVLHIGVLITLLLISRRHSGVAAEPTRSESQWSSPLSAIAGAVGSVLAAACLFRILALPDPYDSLTYHLELPARWLAGGGLELVPTYFGDLAPSYTPAAIEGTFAAFMLPSGSDSLARIGQLPFLALAAVSIYRLSGRGLIGGLAAAMFASLPEVFIQATGSMVDLASTAVFLAALDQLDQCRRSGRSGPLLLAGALTGLFVASRFTSLVFAPLLIPAIARALNSAGVEDASRADPAHSRTVRAFLFAMAAFATGAYPYVRNWLLTGNPIFPAQVEIFGTVLPGLFSREALLASRYHLADFEIARSLLWDRFGAAGLGVFLGALATTSVALIRGWRRSPTAATSRQPRDHWIGMELAILGLVAVGLHFVAIPYNANTRFLFVAWALLVCALGRSLRSVPAGTALCGIGTAAVWIAYGVKIPEFLLRPLQPGSLPLDIGSIGALTLGAIATFGGALGWLLAGRGPVARRLTLCLGVIAFLGCVDLSAEYRRAHWTEIVTRDRRIADCAEALKAIAALEEPQRVAYTGRNTPYLLRGPGLEHDVVFVPVDGREINAPPHAFGTHGGSVNNVDVALLPDRAEPRHGAWTRRVQESGIDVIAIFSRSSPESDWVTRTPGIGPWPGALGGGLELYRVTPP